VIDEMTLEIKGLSEDKGRKKDKDGEKYLKQELETLRDR
jgi:hypothetical protein